MKLIIALRVYPKISKVPPIYPDDKLALFECSCRSLKSGLGQIDYVLHVVLDSCPSEYSEMLKSVFPEERLVLHSEEKVGNMGTFKKQIDILLNQNPDDFVYFAEDDYLYTENSFLPMLEVLKNGDADFVTAYDHPDYDNLLLHAYSQPKEQLAGHNWRDVGCTCLTFLTTNRVLRETSDHLATYSLGNTDAATWLGLTKRGVFNPKIVFGTIFTSKFYLRIYYQIIKFSFARLFFGKKYKLLSPLPSLGTHLENNYVAKGVNWNEVAKENEPKFTLKLKSL